MHASVGGPANLVEGLRALHTVSRTQDLCIHAACFVRKELLTASKCSSDGRNAPVPARTSHTSPEPNRPSSADSDSPVLVSVARGIAEAEKVLAMPSPQRQPNAEPRLTTLKPAPQSSSDCRVPSSGSRFHLPRPLSPDPNCLVSGDSATRSENTLQAPPSIEDFSHPPCPQCRQQEAKICSLELQLSREKGLHAETDKALKEAVYNRLVDQGKLEAALAENASLMRRLRCAEKTGHEKDTIFNELKTRAHNLETHLQASRIKVQNLEQKEVHWSSEEAKLRHGTCSNLKSFGDTEATTILSNMNLRCDLPI